jgi:hypothetical protein
MICSTAVRTNFEKKHSSQIVSTTRSFDSEHVTKTGNDNAQMYVQIRLCNVHIGLLTNEHKGVDP